MNAEVPPPNDRRKRMDMAGKVWAWIQGRRTANTIAKHGQAIVALTAVTAAGVAGYGAVEVHQQGERVNALAARVANTELALIAVRMDVAAAVSAVDRLDRRSAKALRDMAARLEAASASVRVLADMVASLPPAPDVRPLAASVARLARDTAAAASAAEKAPAAAADQHDAEAREAAQGALDTASAARRTAESAAAAADLAAQKAAEALARPEPSIPPPYTPPPAVPYRRVITLPDYTDPPGAGGQVKTFTVDLERGTYSVVLEFHAEGVQPWYAEMSYPGQPFVRYNGTGAGDGRVELTLETGGGTTTFSVRRDGFNPNTPAVFTNTVITIEETP
jgi:hypothetical protein